MITHPRFPRHILVALALTGLAGLAGGCGGCTGTPPGASKDAGQADAAPGGRDTGGDPSLPLFRSCVDGAVPADLPTVDWNHLDSDVISEFTPWHSAQDIVAATGSSTVLAAKFSYGSISKDLEDERIEVWIDDCAGGYTRLGERLTDDDGRIALPLDAADMPDVGEHRVYFRVMGDNSAAFATLRVYPPGTAFIVFDIDATLTTSDSELVGQVVSEILDNNVVPEAREGAEDITLLRNGTHIYELVYLTGRPYLLTGLTRDWLTDLGFPRGTVRLTDSVAASWPSDSAVGQYKADFLNNVIIGQGFTIYAAYGNATSDIYAYEQAGVAKDRTFILGENGGLEQTIGLGESYLTHIDEVTPEAPASQPFRR